MKKYVAELFGTFVLVFVGVGAIVAGDSRNDACDAGSHGAATASWIAL
jgi:glycerol uptake facilitator-like aquaporin